MSNNKSDDDESSMVMGGGDDSNNEINHTNTNNETNDDDFSTPSTPSRRSLQRQQEESQPQMEDNLLVPPTPQERTHSVPSTPASRSSTTSSRRVRRRLNDNLNNNDNNDNDQQEEVDMIIPPTPMSGGSINSKSNHSRSNDHDMNMSVGTLTTAGYGSYGGMSTTVRSNASTRNRNTNDNVDDESDIQKRLQMLDDNTDDEDDDGNNNRTSSVPFQPQTIQVDDNDDDDIQNQQQHTVFRGTDINVRSVELAFKDFLQNFISMEESDKIVRRGEREKRNLARRARRNRRTSGAGDGGGDDDDNDHDDNDSFSSIDSVEDDEDSTQIPLYTDKLRDILLGRKPKSTNDNDDVANHTITDDNETMTSSSAISTNAALDLNTIHLFYHSPQCQQLYYQLVSYPGEVIPLMDLIVVREMEALLAQLHDEKNEADESNIGEYATLHPLNIPIPRVQVRPFHLKSLSHMRSLDPQNIDNLLSIRGMIVRTSPIIPDLKVAHFECCICSSGSTVTLERGRVAEPTVCPTCNLKNTFELIHNRSLFADKQMVRIQETPNEVPPGETPASIVLFAYDDLVDAVRPGDRVEVTGVFRAQGRRTNPKISKVKTVYKTYLDVIHFRRVSGDGSDGQKPVTMKDNNTSDSNTKDDEEGVEQGKGIAIENVGGKLSEKRIEQLETLAKSPDIYDKLVKSLAPSIWELDDVKRGILCMLFGGNSMRVKKGAEERRKRLERERSSDYDVDDSDMVSVEDAVDGSDASKLNKRGDINILLCGDPGTSKSQLLSYVHKLAPRGVYTSGKGSSAVGLTASVVRDPETKDLVLESGALVLSDLGICCIDEFDKMSDTTRAILHEAMEQQTVSIAKAGIIATLNARTSILASANPVESRYNPQLSVVDNIKLPPTLLSRFDLIYLILDAPNVEGDRRLAQHLVGLYYDTPNVVQPPLDHNLLRDYIAYARDNIFPELSDLATRELISAYLDMRKMGATNGNGSRTISATPRQLESLIRLSEGLAKMRFSRVVERSDVKEAVRLMKVATQAAATDPRTGRIDMDMITTGRSTANREMEEALNLSLKELLAEVSLVDCCLFLSRHKFDSN